MLPPVAAATVAAGPASLVAGAPTVAARADNGSAASAISQRFISAAS
jgi:hypothetical protein